jgi:hypothetical protein
MRISTARSGGKSSHQTRARPLGVISLFGSFRGPHPRTKNYSAHLGSRQSGFELEVRRFCALHRSRFGRMAALPNMAIGLSAP